MSELLDKFVASTSLTGELELIVDPDLLPAFDTSVHSRLGLAEELGPLVGRALRTRAEFTNSVPRLNAVRERHLALVEASRSRGVIEHQASLQRTLQPSPRGAALFQVADNELAASLHLRNAAHSIITELGGAFAAMNSRLDIFDAEAALTLTEEDQQPSWHYLARGAISWYLSDETK